MIRSKFKSRNVHQAKITRFCLHTSIEAFLKRHVPMIFLTPLLMLYISELVL